MNENLSRGPIERATVGRPMVKGAGDSLGIDTSAWNRGSFERVTVGRPVIAGSGHEPGRPRRWVLTFITDDRGNETAMALVRAAFGTKGLQVLEILFPPGLGEKVVQFQVEAETPVVEQFTTEAKAIPHVRDAKAELGIAA